MTDISRRNSLSSFQSNISISTTPRDISLNSISHIEDKFKPQVRGKIKKTGNEIYYFPNGEVFIPRQNPKRKHGKSRVMRSGLRGDSSGVVSRNQSVETRPIARSESRNQIPRYGSMNQIQSSISRTGSVQSFQRPVSRHESMQNFVSRHDSMIDFRSNGQRYPRPISRHESMRQFQSNGSREFRSNHSSLNQVRSNQNSLIDISFKDPKPNKDNISIKQLSSSSNLSLNILKLTPLSSINENDIDEKEIIQINELKGVNIDSNGSVQKDIIELLDKDNNRDIETNKEISITDQSNTVRDSTRDQIDPIKRQSIHLFRQLNSIKESNTINSNRDIPKNIKRNTSSAPVIRNPSDPINRASVISSRNAHNTSVISNREPTKQISNKEPVISITNSITEPMKQSIIPNKENSKKKSQNSIKESVKPPIKKQSINSSNDTKDKPNKSIFKKVLNKLFNSKNENKRINRSQSINQLSMLNKSITNKSINELKPNETFTKFDDIPIKSLDPKPISTQIETDNLVTKSKPISNENSIPTQINEPLPIGNKIPPSEINELITHTDPTRMRINDSTSIEEDANRDNSPNSINDTDYTTDIYLNFNYLTKIIEIGDTTNDPELILKQKPIQFHSNNSKFHIITTNNLKNPTNSQPVKSSLKQNQQIKTVKFDKNIYINETYSSYEYNRFNLQLKQTSLKFINEIKFELNFYKNKMIIHELSKQNTQFFV